MKHVQITDSAQADLKSVRRYSNRVWGREQTQQYITAIRDAIKGVAAGIGVSRTRDDLRPGLRMIKSGRHCVFFEDDDSRVLVVRVLHERMDFPRHIE